MRFLFMLESKDAFYFDSRFVEVLCSELDEKKKEISEYFDGKFNMRDWSLTISPTAFRSILISFERLFRKSLMRWVTIERCDFNLSWLYPWNSDNMLKILLG